MIQTKQATNASAKPRGLSVVVPTYNEVASLCEFIPRVSSVLAGLPVESELILVDDHSPDGSAEYARALSRASAVPTLVIERLGARSLSLSVLEGARAAHFDSVLVLDCDLSHDPQDIPRVAEAVLKGDADIAIASRYVDGGAITSWPLRRRIMSSVGTLVARTLTRINDPLSGFFAVRNEILTGQGIALRPRGYKILLEVVALCRKLRISEVPIRFHDRLSGKSKFGSRQAIEFLMQIATLTIRQIWASIRLTNRERGVACSLGKEHSLLESRL